ncbi:Dabb family protein [Methylibium sp. Root1272]|uniref:Dabb family protein n=1 Tax=Methylibium sp. Root1272 TaxID=1736441 RepID=UPI0009E67B7C|nr:Dabb family protein [Methylibium sp. Root1272]
MIWHIVMWTLHDARDADHFREALLSCSAIVPGIRQFEVGVRTDQMPASVDLCLLSSFDNESALHAYLEHPQHLQISRALAPLRRERHVIDFDSSRS